jgi:hypothetical protein
MIGQLFRPLLRFLFWSRLRLITAVAVLVIVVAITGRVAGCASEGPSGHPAARTAAPAAPAAPVATAVPQPSGTPATQPSRAAAASTPPATAAPAPAQALGVAREFLAAWVSRGPGRTAAIQACATAQLAASVTGPGAGYAPATALTGPMTVTGQAAGTVSLTVPTNAGPALLTIRLAGGRWVAAQLILGRTGD